MKTVPLGKEKQAFTQDQVLCPIEIGLSPM